MQYPTYLTVIKYLYLFMNRPYRPTKLKTLLVFYSYYGVMSCGPTYPVGYLLRTKNSMVSAENSENLTKP